MNFDLLKDVLLDVSPLVWALLAVFVIVWAIAKVRGVRVKKSPPLTMNYVAKFLFTVGIINGVMYFLEARPYTTSGIALSLAISSFLMCIGIGLEVFGKK